MNPPAPAMPPDYIGYADLTALKTAHARLIQRQGEPPLAPDFLDTVDGFVLQAQATGHVLGDDDSRTTAQTIIDYWVTVLLRGRHNPPETGLAEFGFHGQAASIHERTATEYLTDERVAIRKRLRLSAAAAQWNDSKRDGALLWGGPELRDAAQYDDLTALEREFIAASQAQERNTRMLWWAVGACLVCGLMLVSVLVTNGRAAQKLARVQEENRRKVQNQFASNLVSHAASLMRGGDVAGSLLSLTQALGEDQRAKMPEDTHRIRIGAAIAQLPRLRFALREPDESYLLSNATFSRDGTALLTVSNRPDGSGGLARLWNPESGTRTAELAAPGMRMIEAGFCHDGRILTASGNVMTGKSELRLWKPDGTAAGDLGAVNGAILGAALTPAGDRVALVLAGGDGRVFIEVRQIADGLSLTGALEWTGEVRQVSFSPDGNYIAACGAIPLKQPDGMRKTAGQVRVWNAWTGAASSIGNMIHDLPVNCVTFSADNTHVVTGSGEIESDVGTVEVWSIFTGKPVAVDEQDVVADHQFTADRLFSAEHDGQVRSVAFSPDDRTVLSASFDETARLWNWRDTNSKPVLTLQHENAVFDAEFSPDGRYILTGGRDQTARVWRIATGVQALPPLHHGKTVFAASFSPDGESLLTMTTDAVRVWRRRTGEPVAPVLRLGDPVWKTAISADGSRVVAVSQSGIIGTWDTLSGTLEGDTESRPALYGADAIFFNADARLALLVTGPDARIVDTKYDSPPRPRLPKPGTVTYAAFSEDGTRVLLATGARGASDGTTEIRQTARDDASAPVVLATGGAVNYAKFSPDGRYVLTAGGTDTPPHGEARVWDAATGAPVTPPLVHDELVTHASFNPGLTAIATASTDDSAKIWHIDLAKKTAEQAFHLRSHSADLICATFTPDGRKLATASFDRTAILWDAMTGTRLATLPHDKRINDVAFSPDSHFAVTACADQAARVWEVSTGNWVSLFAHEGEVTRAFFSRDTAEGLKVVTLSSHEFGKSAREGRQNLAARHFDRIAKVQTWRLPAATEPVEELTRFAQVLRVHAVDAEGGFVRLTRPEFAAAYDRVRDGLLARYNRDLPPLRNNYLVTESEETGEWFAAKWHLSRLIDLDAAQGKPGDPELFERRGMASARLLDWAAALADYEVAIASERPPPRIFVRQARADIALMRWDDAVRHITAGMTRGGDARTLLMLRAEAHAASERWTESAADLAEAMRLKPNLPSTYQRLGTVRLKQAQPAAYRDLCAELLRRFRTDEGLFSTVAWACALQAGAVPDLRVPVEMARRAVADQPTLYFPRNTLGAVLYRAGKYAEAITRLNESCALYRQAATIAAARGYSEADTLPIQDGREVDWIFLAMAHHRLGHAGEAQAWLKKAREAMQIKTVRDPRRTWHRIELELLLDEATRALGKAEG